MGSAGLRAPVRSADNTIHDLIAVSNDLRRHIDDTLSGLGYVELRPSFAPLLARIWEHGVPQGRLAGAMGVSPQAASHTVGLAERAGYVTRETNPDDRRSKLVALTDLGRSVVRDGATAIAARAEDHAAVLGARRFRRFERTLLQLRDSLGLDEAADPVAPVEPRASVIAVSLLADHATHTLRHALHDAGHDQISGTQNLVLVHIGTEGARSSELARAQRITRQAVTSTLHELESLGYLERRPDADDARGVVFVPTRRGLRALAAYVAGIDALEQRYTEILGPTDYAEMATSAHELSVRVRLDRTLSGVVTSPLADGARPQAEVDELAADLWRWLGAPDALRLSKAIGLLAVDSSRASRSDLAGHAAGAGP